MPFNPSQQFKPPYEAVLVVQASVDTNTANIASNTTAINTINNTTIPNINTILTNVPVTKGGTGTTTQFTLGSILIALANGTYGQDNANLFFDAINKRFGLGTNTPTATLEVKGSSFISSGVSSHVLIDPTISQSATAGYEALVINSTESTVGSGVKNLIRAAVGGTTKATLTNTGSLALGSANTPTEILDVAGNIRFRHLRGAITTAAPTVVKGTGAGTTATANMATNSSDAAGTITITVAGTVTTNAVVCTITFNAAYTVVPVIMLTPANANASFGGSNPNILVPTVAVWASATNTTFTITSVGTLTAGTYIWNYQVIQPT